VAWRVRSIAMTEVEVSFRSDVSDVRNRSCASILLHVTEHLQYACPDLFLGSFLVMWHPSRGRLIAAVRV
jgi:hypothetical protein